MRMGRSKNRSRFDCLEMFRSKPAVVAAANGLLDRGHGKATHHIEANVNVYDSLSFAEKEALLAVLESLDVDAADANGEPTRH